MILGGEEYSGPNQRPALEYNRLGGQAGGGGKRRANQSPIRKSMPGLPAMRSIVVQLTRLSEPSVSRNYITLDAPELASRPWLSACTELP